MPARDGETVGQREFARLRERWACQIVGLDLGVDIVEWDTDGRQGVPDGRFARAGRDGFLEVTSIGDPKVVSGESVYRELAEWRLDTSSWSFVVHVDPRVEFAAFKEHVVEVVAAIERTGTTDLWALLDQLDSPVRDWLEQLIEDGRLEVHATALTDRPGTIYVVPAMSIGGVAPDNPDVMLPAINDTLTQPTIDKRLKKLAATGDSEQHLLVFVRSDAWPWNALCMLVSERVALPTTPPAVPGHLDGVWFVNFYNRAALSWTRSRGWRWVPFEDDTTL